MCSHSLSLNEMLDEDRRRTVRVMMKAGETKGKLSTFELIFVLDFIKRFNMYGRSTMLSQAQLDIVDEIALRLDDSYPICQTSCKFCEHVAKCTGNPD